ncbi:YaaC family protein [Cerasicoccus fimbriatus]|uniref:YaaC family protein n=1 Tax=Cerasicoccus fimbriatus TaxID=3014554 RepID=UPI0022B57CCF|nr:YaaC family protein [Cerasicoccus sp. TK19100]
MSKPIEIGEPALYKYQAVKYFHFDVEAGASLVLTSNPWSYLSAWLSQKESKSRGKTKEKFSKAKYFVEQAESFHLAAESTRLPTKATLVYYSCLNLVKGFLSVKGVELEQHNEHHGISLPIGNTQELSFSGNIKNCLNIFQEFNKVLGIPKSGKCSVPINQLFSEIPEVHELAFTLGHLPLNRRKYLPVDIRFHVNDRRDYLFTVLKFEKKNESRVPVEKFYKGKRKSYFVKASDNVNGWTIYRSIKRKKVTNNNFNRIYRNICKEYSDLGFASILTRGGYRYYANLDAGPFHQLASTLALLFFAGSAARYRPSMTQNLLKGDLQPILTEAVETCPTQFLYQIASLITDSVCAVPQAKI